VHSHLYILRPHPLFFAANLLQPNNDAKPSDGLLIIKVSLADFMAEQRKRRTHVIASGVEHLLRFVVHLVARSLISDGVDPYQLLGAKDLVDTSALASFLARCQFKFGGIAKSPGEHPGKRISHSFVAACSVFCSFRPLPHIPFSCCYFYPSTGA
jgi:hypothetical protein